MVGRDGLDLGGTQGWVYHRYEGGLGLSCTILDWVCDINTPASHTHVSFRALLVVAGFRLVSFANQVFRELSSVFVRTFASPMTLLFAKIAPPPFRIAVLGARTVSPGSKVYARNRHAHELDPYEASLIDKPSLPRFTASPPHLVVLNFREVGTTLLKFTLQRLIPRVIDFPHFVEFRHSPDQPFHDFVDMTTILGVKRCAAGGHDSSQHAQTNSQLCFTY